MTLSLMRKKWWRSNPLQQPFVVVGLSDHDGGKDGIRDGEQRAGKEGRRAGARAAVRPAAALQGGRGRRQRGNGRSIVSTPFFSGARPPCEGV